MTATKPTVRDDQHGTITGYSYGCRCNQCRIARRKYFREHEYADRVSPEAVDAVFAALQHEADMDGIVTATGDRLSELTEVSRVTANKAVHKLADDGLIEIVGTVGLGGVLEIRLADFA